MPVYPHRIRLRGPWECVPLETRAGAPLPMPRRVTMPGRLGDHGLAAFVGRVRYTRKFGYPGRIDDFERIWLTCDGLEGTADIQLNGVQLGHTSSGSFCFEVTSLMMHHNSLEITLAADSHHGGLWGEVALEIRCSAYLSDMRTRRNEDGSIEVTGAVVGTCDRSLELYGLADGAHVHYQLIEARQEGTPFRFAVPPREVDLQRLRVDLINVSTTWYVWELEL
jgi:Glycosyl hydrolase 2 galactose-binding domain-like